MEQSMLDDRYRKTWIFAQRVRRGIEPEDSMVFLKHISSTDASDGVRQYAQRQYLSLKHRNASPAKND